MRTKIINLIRKIFGIKSILDRLEHIETELKILNGGEYNNTANSLRILPGTEHARYALPLDYPPSRALAPRYGYTHNKIESLEQWFAAHNSDYAKFLVFMKEVCPQHISLHLSDSQTLVPAWSGGPIAAFDSLALYAMVLKHKPATYLEIGSGMTTLFAHQAIIDKGLKTKIISIDPEPRREIDELCDEVIRKGLETYDLSIFDTLAAGDIVFFDGSHRCFMNSDVTIFFIDVLPRLKPGVIVHVHDIMLPWDYHGDFKHWYWNEQYMLAVYLMTQIQKLNPLLPTTWVCRSPEFESFFSDPLVDLGSPLRNSLWRGGGSMWFTKKM